MSFLKSAEEKEFDLNMLDDVKRLNFWVTGDYRGYYDITQDTTPKALKMAKRIKFVAA